MEELVFDVVYLVSETEPLDESEAGSLAAMGLTDADFLADSTGEEAVIVF